MDGDFVLEEYEWYYQADRSRIGRDRHRQKTEVGYRFLQSNQLTTRQLLADHEEPFLGLKLLRRDLTNEGYDFYSHEYLRWIQSIDRGQEPSAKALKGYYRKYLKRTANSAD